MNKVERLDSKIKELEAKRAAVLKAESRQARADDTRRKIIVGSLVLRGADRNETAKQSLYNKLRAELTRPADRLLFGLDEQSELPQNEPQQPDQQPPHLRQDQAA